MDEVGGIHKKHLSLPSLSLGETRRERAIVKRLLGGESFWLSGILRGNQL